MGPRNIFVTNNLTPVLLYLTGQHRTLTAPATWHESYFQILRFLAATSASLTDPPYSNLSISCLITSLHRSVGSALSMNWWCAGVHFLENTNHIYALNLFKKKKKKKKKNWRRRFRLNVSSGCFVLVLMCCLRCVETRWPWRFSVHNACQKHLALYQEHKCQRVSAEKNDNLLQSCRDPTLFDRYRNGELHHDLPPHVQVYKLHRHADTQTEKGFSINS